MLANEQNLSVSRAFPNCHLHPIFPFLFDLHAKADLTTRFRGIPLTYKYLHTAAEPHD